MEISVRSYVPDDYDKVATLYKQPDLFGGQFDENRDSAARLAEQIAEYPDTILVAEGDGEMVGTVSLIVDKRVAWLFRFCVVPGQQQDEVAEKLFARAGEVFTEKGHHQVLAYTPAGNETLNDRYDKLGFTHGNDYTCFWKNI